MFASFEVRHDQGMLERSPAQHRQAGSAPGPGRPVKLWVLGPAGVAHLAERDLPKVEVAGSIPVSRLLDFPLSSAQRHVVRRQR